MDRPPALVELRLVTACTRGRLAGRLEESQAAQQSDRRFPFLRADASLDLRDVDATRAE
jgi:hypothetical protein